MITKIIRSDKFDIEFFQNYVETYTERYPDQQNIMFLDMLYGIGISVDPVEYKGPDGFKRFIKWMAESYLEIEKGNESK